MTATAMLAAARKDLGLVGRPNRITRDYASRHGTAFLEAAWCDMSITWWARGSGNAEAVLPEGDRAFTIWHAEDGQQLGRWYWGTTANVKAHAVPGSVIFFAWEGTDRVGDIDHVGLVEHNLGDGRVQTIEGNTGDACKRRVRAANVIAGFWTPDYAAKMTWTEKLVKELPLLELGDDNFDVKTARADMFARDRVPAKVYAVCGLEAWLKRTKFDPEFDGLVRAFQKVEKLKVDGQVGENTWAALARVAS